MKITIAYTQEDESEAAAVMQLLRRYFSLHRTKVRKSDRGGHYKHIYICIDYTGEKDS